MSRHPQFIAFFVTLVIFALSAGCGTVDETASVGTPLSAVAKAGGGGAGGPGSDPSASSGTLEALDDGEVAHLLFMREEEKLARDVYLTFAAWYPESPIFETIATRAEQTHTDAVLEKLLAYGLADPNPETNNLPDAIGVFTGDAYGPYFSAKFAELTLAGSQSLLDALRVGALIEELDMDDIVNCPEEIVSQDNGIDEGACGMLHTDNPDLATLYGNILDGSKSHLRAFVARIESFVGEGNYQAQYLTQQEVDEILGR